MRDTISRGLIGLSGALASVGIEYTDLKESIQFIGILAGAGVAVISLVQAIRIEFKRRGK